MDQPRHTVAMGDSVNGRLSSALGWATVVRMAAAAVSVLVTSEGWLGSAIGNELHIRIERRLEG